MLLLLIKREHLILASVLNHITFDNLVALHRLLRVEVLHVEDPVLRASILLNIHELSLS